MEGLVAQAKWLVEHLIWFHLNYGGDYSSMAHMGADLLSMNPDLDQLQSTRDRKIARYEKAIRIRGGE